jgi:uncharacterized protein (TIGR03118 family)
MTDSHPFKQLKLCSFIAAATILAGNAWAQHYQQTNLVSNVAGVAPHTDPNLVNGWGIARSSSSPWWVSDNGTGHATLYDGNGNPQSLVVTVPGAPTGAVFNGSGDFELAPGKPARFIFVSEDGTISGWNPGVDATNAVVVVNNPGAVYKGVAIATVGDQRFLYATDFHAGRIDVFDKGFKMLTKGNESSRGFRAGGGGFFLFEGNPRGLVPFNVQNIGDNLFVTFAKQDAAKEDDVAGPGNGLVAVFTPRGRLLRFFQHVPELNAPWGLTLAPADFGSFSHHLIVGQFGSGEILAFNMETGAFEGNLLTPEGQPIVIDGIWGIGFGNGGTAGPANTLFFAAGPNDEQNGLFGRLDPVASDLIQGNGN